MKVRLLGWDRHAIFSLDPADGGSLEDPMFMHHIELTGGNIGHTASFTWDGKYIIFGHEPGGGSQAPVPGHEQPVDRTFFFIEVGDG